jgi:ribose transport system substrate-binding protein
VDLVRAHGGQDGGFMAPYDWEGWAAVDTMNRVFHGQRAVPNGIGLALWDRDHNMPPSGGRVTPPVDHRSGYLKAWGVT